MRTAVFLLAFSPVLAQAQSWCPPGAEWLFNFNSDQANGVRRAWYAGDTLINGLPCQRIDQMIIAYEPVPPNGSPFTVEDQPIITNVQGDLVRIWDASETVFDTLAWFGAVPGDRWIIPQYEFTNAGYFEVLDTGTRVIAGISLRYLVVEEPIVMGFVDTLIERIGFLRFYIRPIETIIIDQQTHGLVCYRDAGIPQYEGWFPQHPCDFTLLLNDEVDAPLGSAFPNPGTDHFTLQLANGAHTIEVFDATGRSVLRERTSSPRPTIATTQLEPGLYLLQVDDLAVQRWVRE